MKFKSETKDYLLYFFRWVQTQFNSKVKILRTDNGLEFDHSELLTYYHENGMERQSSCTDTPQPNGVVERKHRHVLEVVRALRFQASLRIHFWGECVLTATYLVNRMPLSILQNKSPYEVLLGKLPNYDHLRSFGCPCYSHVNSKPRDKFASRSRPGVFVGYPNGKKGYQIFDLEDKHIYTSRDVQFFEESYPRHNPFVAPHESQQPDSSVFGPHATMDSPLDAVRARNKPDDIIQTVVPLSESNCAIPELHSNEQQAEPNEVIEGSDPNKIISGALDSNNLTPESNSSLSEISIPAKRVRKVFSKLSGTDPVRIHKLKQYLDQKFHIKDLGKLKYFLGIEVARSTSGVSLSQRKYVLDILSESGLLGSKPSSTPMDQQHKLTPDAGSICSDPGQYRRLVGRLLYLTITRPDISYAVHVLSQFMHAPRQPHLDAAFQVLRYLKGAPGQGILLPANSSLTLRAYCDADWAGCPSTRRSTTGYIIFLGSSPISWRSKKQSVVSRSSAEAEYRAMATTSSEIIWLVRLLQDLHVPCTSHVSLFCDNQAAIHIAANPVFHERTKHIEIDCHFIRQHIQSQAPTSYEGVDFHTRALQHSNIQLTCDEDEPQRSRSLKRKFNADQLAELELEEFMASDESGTDEEEDDNDAMDEKRHKKQDMYRALIQSGDMEVTFNTGLEDISQRILEKKNRKSETVWEAYNRKRKEKKKARKNRAKDSSEDESSDIDQEPAEQPDDFFIEESPPKGSKEGRDDKGADTNLKGYNLKLKKSRGKVAKETPEEGKLPTADYDDPRFSSIFTSPLFALDPTDPQFKRNAKNESDQLPSKKEKLELASLVKSIKMKSNQVPVPSVGKTSRKKGKHSF
ncbi:hypothetical protein RJ640_011585 [Escallonia rubra]|uniref:Integrase catalytic domain-containing protein n=1 Tax=Escallonia rubra TaxID=112253 RepID=A0AA88RXP7_9ASTE|nr:hypothetical protein RJ640_011585 [Escallonia rubra]